MLLFYCQPSLHPNLLNTPLIWGHSNRRHLITIATKVHSIKPLAYVLFVGAVSTVSEILVNHTNLVFAFGRSAIDK
jgi:hypothetical protein